MAYAFPFHSIEYICLLRLFVTYKFLLAGILRNKGLLLDRTPSDPRETDDFPMI